MPKVQTCVDLLLHNTFRVPARAKYFLEINKVSDIPSEPALVLGKGANILFTKDYDGLVIKNNLKGKKVLKDGLIEVASGEDWIDFVNWSVDNGWSGIENLAYIPGTVGAAAYGNIGAYGQNFEDVIVSVKTNKGVLNKKDCALDYRGSFFKKHPEYFITSVIIKLSQAPQFDTHYYSRYESLATQLVTIGKATPYSSKDIAEAVISLRKQKLPDWTKIGTAGSFFKNPNITQIHLKKIQKEIPDIQTYPTNKLSYDNTITDLVKVPAGRLLDELGWKGKRIGNVGTFEKQALCVVNYGGATGQEILEFTKKMQSAVKKAYNIDLEPEVNII